MSAKRDPIVDRKSLMNMIHGIWHSRCLSVLVGFKIPELLCNAREESLSIEDIASQTGCTSTKQIYQVMRVLAQWGIGIELENKYFAKNQAMEQFRRDREPSMGHLVEYFCNEEMWKAAVSFPEAVKQNCPAFVLKHGMNHFQYMYAIDSCPYHPQKMSNCNFSEHLMGSNKRRQELAKNYYDAMSAWSNIQILADEPGLSNVYKVFPWSSCTKLMDVGGCSGDFLASILKQPGCEHIQGYVVDLPAVIDEAKQNAHNLGVPTNRILFMKQEFSEPLEGDLQSLQVDTILLKNVINMIDLESATKVLKHCRSLLCKEGRILVAMSCIPEAGDSEFNVGENGVQWGFVQIHVMCLTNGLKMSKSERREHLTKVGAGCDLKVSEVYDTFNGGVTLFELRPI